MKWFEKKTRGELYKNAAYCFEEISQNNNWTSIYKIQKITLQALIRIC